MLILCDFPTINKAGGRIIFCITERVRNELNYEISRMYTKNIIYVEDLLTGDTRALYTKDLYELMATNKEYLQLNKFDFYKL